MTTVIEENIMTSRSGNKKKEQTKISVWLSNQVLELVDQTAKSYGISRSDYVRLTLRQTLVIRGLLPHETQSLLPEEQGV